MSMMGNRGVEMGDDAPDVLPHCLWTKGKKLTVRKLLADENIADNDGLVMRLVARRIYQSDRMATSPPAGYLQANRHGGEARRGIAS